MTRYIVLYKARDGNSMYIMSNMRKNMCVNIYFIISMRFSEGGFVIKMGHLKIHNTSISI